MCKIISASQIKSSASQPKQIVKKHVSLASRLHIMQNDRTPILQQEATYQALLMAIFSAGRPCQHADCCSAASCASLRCVVPNATDSETHWNAVKHTTKRDVSCPQKKMGSFSNGGSLPSLLYAKNCINCRVSCVFHCAFHNVSQRFAILTASRRICMFHWNASRFAHGPSGFVKNHPMYS